MQDPRFRNELPPGSDPGAYFKSYASLITEAAATVDGARLSEAHALLMGAVEAGRRVYVAGNGGSAAVADHLCCDFMKGTHKAGHPAIRAQSLVANGAVYTALANDFGFETAIATQIEYLAEAGDVVMLISSSGNSPNIIKAAEVSRAKGAKVIGLSGFSGGKLREVSDVPLYVAANNYGVVEDVHQMIMHALAQFIAKARDGKA